MIEEQELWAKIEIGSGCWIWIGPKGHYGYGLTQWHGKQWRVHRLIWTLKHGPIPKGLWVLHKCDNPPCIRPDHMFLGTAADNMLDKSKKGRCNSPIGARNSQTKLSENAVHEIRKLLRKGWTISSIARTYGMNLMAISDIKRGKTWKHLKDL